MAVAEVDKQSELKAELLAHKKRASDLQGEVDRFSVERKSHADIEAANADLKDKLADAKAEAKELADQLAEAKGELAKASKNLAKAEKQLGAAHKIKEGLAELG